MSSKSIFTQEHKPRSTRFIQGFDNIYSNLAIGHVEGKKRILPALVAETATDESLWRVVNLKSLDDNKQNVFDAVAVLGAVDNDEAAAWAMQQHGRFFDSTVVGEIVETNSHGLMRHLANPDLHLYQSPIRGRDLAPLQDVTIGQRAVWDGVELISHGGLTANLLHDLMKHDDNNQLFDAMKAADMPAWIASLDVEREDYDALIVQNSRLDLMMSKLSAAMARATDSGVTVVQVSQSEPFKRNKVVQVAAIFEFSDGQSMSIIFHNPDVQPNQLLATDTLISWKWLLNGRDVSAAVQPNQGEDVQIPVLAMRLMKIVNKNSARFTRTLAKKDENLKALGEVQTRIADKTQTVADLDAEIVTLQAELDKPVLPAKEVRLRAVYDALKNIGWAEVDLLLQKTVGGASYKALNSFGDGLTNWTVVNTKAAIKPPTITDDLSLSVEDMAKSIDLLVGYDVDGIDPSLIKNGDYVRVTTTTGDSQTPLGSVFEGMVVGNNPVAGKDGVYRIDIQIKDENARNGTRNGRFFSDRVVFEKIDAPTDDQAKIAAVDAEFEYGDATPKFKEWMFESLTAEDYSPFASSRQLERWIKTTSDGKATIKWVSFDEAGTVPTTDYDAEGIVSQGGEIIGYISMGGDGKCMVFVADGSRVKSNSGYEYRFTEDMETLQSMAVNLVNSSKVAEPMTPDSFIDGLTAGTLVRAVVKDRFGNNPDTVIEGDYVDHKRSNLETTGYTVRLLKGNGQESFINTMSATFEVIEQVDISAPDDQVQADGRYLQSLINGTVDFSDGDAIEAELTAIADRLTPETEPLFEQAAEAYAQWAISQAATV